MPDEPDLSGADRAPAALCVSIHDVAPYHWGLCERLLRGIAEVAPLPVTLLVVPDFHRRGNVPPDWYREALDARLAAGDELALHGHAHLDEGPPPATLPDWWRRRVLTAGEGEFATLPAAIAHARLMDGRRWFDARGWPLHGFVAPAWLLGDGAWRALAASPFLYTTTASHFHLLRPRLAQPMPVIAYSSRSLWRRAASLAWQAGHRLPAAQPARLALHPADAAHPAILQQAQRRLESLLRSRQAMTKHAFATALQAGQPHPVAAPAGLAAHRPQPRCQPSPLR